MKRCLALVLALAVNVAALVACARAPDVAEVRASALGVARGEVANPPVGHTATDPGSSRLAAPAALSARATRDLLRAVTPPPRDEADIVRRFKQVCGTPAAARVPLYRDEAVGETRTFWVLDEPNHRFFDVRATLQYASEHLLLYVQDGLAAPPATDKLEASARVFEETTYPALRRYFGEPPEAPRITVFNGRVPGVGGYFSASDLYPREVNPYSNERPMLFMNLDATRPGTASYDSVLAHEVQHFIHWAIHPQQDSWLNEGASELAMSLAGFDQGGVARSFLTRPETQLNGWAERPTETIPHYGAGYLFLEYFAQRLGGYEKVKELIGTPGVSVATVENYLAGQQPVGPAGSDGQATPRTFDELFRDFVVANLVNDRTIAGGRFGYEKIRTRAATYESHATYPAAATGSVRPYAMRSIEFRPSASGDRRGALELRFRGAGEAPLYGGAPRSGQAQWWGNAADEMESTLTREVDLTGVEQATLHFAAWFHTEKDYDYAGVAVSTDGGCSWQTMAGQHTADSDPVGQNLGHGLTGRSGGGDTPTWIEEAMDLTPYAGQKIVLRFFYITDQSYHGSGIAVDDISIPEIGFHDDAEYDRGWQARGFLRSVNAAALDWAVQAVVFTDSGVEVRPLVVKPVRGTTEVEGSVTIRGFGDRMQRVVVAVSPLVPVTLEPATFTLEAALR